MKLASQYQVDTLIGQVNQIWNQVVFGKANFEKTGTNYNRCVSFYMHRSRSRVCDARTSTYVSFCIRIFRRADPLAYSADQSIIRAYQSTILSDIRTFRRTQTGGALPQLVCKPF